MSNWHIKLGTECWDILDEEGRLVAWVVSHGHFDMDQAEAHALEIVGMHEDYKQLEREKADLQILVATLCRRLPEDDVWRIRAIEHLNKEDFFNPLRKVVTSKPGGGTEVKMMDISMVEGEQGIGMIVKPVDDAVYVRTVHGGQILIHRKDLTLAFNDMIRAKLHPRNKKKS